MTTPSNLTCPAGRGGFFLIDSRTWTYVCSLGLNPAVFFLVLARGSQGDNLTTSWSVEAAKRYTGLAINRAQEARDSLIRRGVLTQLRGGTKPQYKIKPQSDLNFGGRQDRPRQDRPPLDRLKRTRRSRRDGHSAASGFPSSAVMGLIEETEIEADEEPKDTAIWLPNSLGGWSRQCSRKPPQNYSTVSKPGAPSIIREALWIAESPR
jgi:hypothetical protein